MARGAEEIDEEESAGEEERYREAADKTCHEHVHWEGHDVGCGYADDDIADEGYPAHGPNVGCAAQSVGEVDLSGIAELIQDEGRYEAYGHGYDALVVAEDAHEVASEEDEYERRQGHENEHDMVATPGVAAHVGRVRRPGGVGDLDGDCRAERVVYAEAESADDDDDLESGELDMTHPSGHDTCEGERPRLADHLDGDGVGSTEDFAGVSAPYRLEGEPHGVVAVFTVGEEDHDYGNGAEKAREERAEARTG